MAPQPHPNLHTLKVNLLKLIIHDVKDKALAIFPAVIYHLKGSVTLGNIKFYRETSPKGDRRTYEFLFKFEFLRKF